MTSETRHFTGHFKVDGKWLADFVRSRYHYEHAPEHALKVMSCLKGISMDDAYGVINGDCQLMNDETGDLIHLIHEPDTAFKTELEKHLEWKSHEAERQAAREKEWQEDADRIMAEVDVKEARKQERIRAVSNINLQINKFAEFTDMMSKQFGHVDYYDADVKRKIGEVFKPSDPYAVKWRSFYLGKNWFDTKKFKDDDEIEVIDFNCIPVRKKLLDEYVNHVVDRLREIKRREIREYEKQDFWMIRELESTRRELHGHILIEAGFEPMELSAGACMFRALIEIYLEQKAKLFGVM